MDFILIAENNLIVLMLMVNIEWTLVLSVFEPSL